MRLDRRLLTAVFAGGSIGAVVRALLAEWLVHDPVSWPWATFAANVAGAFLLGIVTTSMPEDGPAPVHLRHLLGTGLCGAFTTFSTVQLELVLMLEAGAVGLAAAYAGCSLAAGLAAAACASNLVRRTRPAG